MAVGKGNRSQKNEYTAATAPAWRVATWSSGASPSPPNLSGADLLLVHFCFGNNIAASSVTHNGNSLTKAGSNYFSGLSQREEFWYMTSPDATGSIVITLASAMYNPICITAMGFTGVDTTTPITGPTFNGATTSPHSRTRTITADSMVFVSGISTVSTDDITIDGTVTTGASGNLMPNQVNNNKIISGMWSNAAHSSTSISTETDASSTTNITNSYIEIMASGGGGGTRRIFLIS